MLLVQKFPQCATDFLLLIVRWSDREHLFVHKENKKVSGGGAGSPYNPVLITPRPTSLPSGTEVGLINDAVSSVSRLLRGFMRYFSSPAQRHWTCSVLSRTQCGEQINKHLYKSLIRSKLDNGCVVYGSARGSYLRMLDLIQNHAVRLCLGAYRTSPSSSLSVLANEPPLYIYQKRLSMQYCLKLSSTAHNLAYSGVVAGKFKLAFDRKPNQILPLGIRVQPDSYHVLPSSVLTNGKIYGTVAREINFILFTPWLAVSSIAKIFPATIPSCSTECELVILVSLTRTYWVVMTPQPVNLAEFHSQ